MKKSFLMFIYLLSISMVAYSQGIQFETGTWSQILKKAKQEKKIIFVDVYTSWCGPCKMVAETVLPQEKVGTFYNEKFINYRLDAEKGEGPVFAKKYGVKAYPSFFYIDGNGQVIFQFVGSLDAEGFIQRGKTVDLFAFHGGYDKMLVALKSGVACDEIFNMLYSSVGEEERTELLSIYLKTMSADKFLAGGYKYLNSLLFYNEEVMDKLADILVKTSNDGRFSNGAFDTLFMRDIFPPYVTKVSEFFHQSIEKGDSVLFQKLLKLKAKFETFIPVVIANNNDVFILDKDLMLTSVDYLQLAYWCENRLNPEQFKEKIVPYMKTILTHNPIGKFREELTYIAGRISWVVLSPDFLNLTYMTSNNVLDWVDYYWKISPTDENTKKLCQEWVKYAYNLQFFNKSIILKSVNLVNRLGDSKECISLLEDALRTRYTMLGDAKVIKELTFMLQAAKNNKL